MVSGMKQLSNHREAGQSKEHRDSELTSCPLIERGKEGCGGSNRKETMDFLLFVFAYAMRKINLLPCDIGGGAVYKLCQNICIWLHGYTFA